ncbi:MAG: hypothetical protein JWM95_1587 [Gemmatimonadetes bacterium]|nr:hypothetical protein [Gemmatimonadota bacterium]
MSLIDLVQQHLTPDVVQNISQQLGTDPDTTQQAIQAALPTMVGGMAQTAQQPLGASALQNAMSAPEGLGGILGSILGQHHDAVHTDVQQATGMDSGKVGKLLILLAPFVLRALAKHQEAAAPGQQNGGLLGTILNGFANGN